MYIDYNVGDIEVTTEVTISVAFSDLLREVPAEALVKEIGKNGDTLDAFSQKDILDYLVDTFVPIKPSTEEHGLAMQLVELIAPESEVDTIDEVEAFLTGGIVSDADAHRVLEAIAYRYDNDLRFTRRIDGLISQPVPEDVARAFAVVSDFVAGASSAGRRFTEADR